MQGLEDLSARKGLHLNPELGQHLRIEAGGTKSQTLEVGNAVDFLVEPAAHLRTGVAGRKLDRVEGCGVILLHLLEAATRVQPGVLLAVGQSERKSSSEGGNRAQAGVVVRGCVARLHSAGLHRLQDLEGRNELAALARVDDESSPRKRRHSLGEVSRPTKNGVEGCRPTGRHLPLDLGKAVVPGRLSCQCRRPRIGCLITSSEADGRRSKDAFPG